MGENKLHLLKKAVLEERKKKKKAKPKTKSGFQVDDKDGKKTKKGSRKKERRDSLSSRELIAETSKGALIEGAQKEVTLPIETEPSSISMSLEVAAAAQISGRKKLGKKKSFSKLKDDATGNFYYHDVETDEVVWDEPTDAVIIDDTEETSVPIASAKAQISGRKKKSFSKLKDDATGNFYYHDIETDEVVWYVVKKKRQLGDTI